MIAPVNTENKNEQRSSFEEGRGDLIRAIIRDQDLRDRGCMLQLTRRGGGEGRVYISQEAL